MNLLRKAETLAEAGPWETAGGIGTGRSRGDMVDEGGVKGGEECNAEFVGDGEGALDLFNGGGGGGGRFVPFKSDDEDALRSTGGDDRLIGESPPD
ncbi:hypothetical protein AAF712_007767 [Marasmius tenuissimus]|uniref:Uncharacterized protein n=1 Tax=Marasmius tenuissimus TaxID=585030 RepID=A0ABR2ZU81_9AGAR